MDKHEWQDVREKIGGLILLIFFIAWMGVTILYWTGM